MRTTSEAAKPNRPVGRLPPASRYPREGVERMYIGVGSILGLVLLILLLVWIF
jgi:hypothetical protein